MTIDELKIVESALLNERNKPGWYLALANALIIIKREIKLKEIKF